MKEHPLCYLSQLGWCREGLWWARSVAVAGSTAYLADADGRVHVFALGDPAHPQRIGACAVPGVPQSAVVGEGHVYVASGAEVWW